MSDPEGSSTKRIGLCAASLPAGSHLSGGPAGNQATKRGARFFYRNRSFFGGFFLFALLLLKKAGESGGHI